MSDVSSPPSLDEFFDEIASSARSEADTAGQSTGTDSNKGDDKSSDAALVAPSTQKKEARVFTYTAPNGNMYNVQHRHASTIRTQEEFTWIMQHYGEYRCKAAVGKGKTWLNENILPGFVALFGARGLTSTTLSKVC